MKSFLMGLLVEIIIILVSIITKNEKVFSYGTQIIGFGGIGLGVISSGLMSENIYRRTAVEDKHERLERVNMSTNLVLFGIPSIIILIVSYILTTK